MFIFYLFEYNNFKDNNFNFKKYIDRVIKYSSILTMLCLCLCTYMFAYNIYTLSIKYSTFPAAESCDPSTFHNPDNLLPAH